MTLPKVLSDKKIIIGIVVVVLLIEAGWAVWTLKKSSLGGSTSGSTEAGVTAAKTPTVLSLTSSKASYKVGDKIEVSIGLSSSKTTDGVDAIILYRPNLLSVESTGPDQAVKLGSMYRDYPLNTVDEKAGRIAISGVTSETGGITPKGILGSVSFRAKSAGKATISFDFTSGSTTDSNVTQLGTGKDILEKVQNLEINITP